MGGFLSSQLRFLGLSFKTTIIIRGAWNAPYDISLIAEVTDGYQYWQTREMRLLGNRALWVHFTIDAKMKLA